MGYNDNLLHKAIRDNLPDETILKLVRENSVKCRERGYNDQLPLHAFLLNNSVSPFVFKAIIEAYPEACSIKAFGALPIHFAASNIESPVIIKILLSHFPQGIKEADKNQHLPLHLASKYNQSNDICSLILQFYPKAARIKDIHGCLPLHYRVQWGKLAFESIGKLISCYPEAVCQKDENDWLPIHYAARSMESYDVIKVLLDIHRYGCCCKTSDSSGGYLPLHLMALNRNASVRMVLEVLSQNPKAIYEKDNYGHLPIHCFMKTIIGFATNKIPLERLLVCQALLSQLPQSIYTRDLKGFRPLDICPVDEVSRLMLNSNYSNLAMTDLQRCRDLNWKSRKVALKLYHHIVCLYNTSIILEQVGDMNNPIALSKHTSNTLQRVFTNLVMFGCSNQFAVATGILQYIIHYL